MKEYVIDAKGKIFGRTASEVAHILQGKKNAAYNPRLAGTDVVIIKNVKDLVVTGKKAAEKVYYRHTGYMGHLKERTFENAFGRAPQTVFRNAVRRMLPKNFLNQRRLRNLRFANDK